MKLLVDNTGPGNYLVVLNSPDKSKSSNSRGTVYRRNAEYISATAGNSNVSSTYHYEKLPYIYREIEGGKASIVESSDKIATMIVVVNSISSIDITGHKSKHRSRTATKILHNRGTNCAPNVRGTKTPSNRAKAALVSAIKTARNSRRASRNSGIDRIPVAENLYWAPAKMGKIGAI